MSKFEVRIMRDSSEAVEYDVRGIPMSIWTRNLSDYMNMRSFPHWHEELEFSYIFSGVFDYHINGQTLRLCPGDCIILNSRQMHYVTPVRFQDATFTCILFHPCLLSENRKLYAKYVASIIKNPNFEYCYYPTSHPFHREISGLILDIISFKQNSLPCYEMQIIGHMHNFWYEFLQESNLLASSLDDNADPSLKIYRDMLAFIHQNYMYKITLDAIAASGNVCRSKCCIIFKQYLGCSPVDFLNRYRLEISYNLLKDKDISITDVAAYCGFSSCSYFTAQFRSAYGYTPSEYRKKIL